MLLYAHTVTPRLRYIAQWFHEHYLDEPLVFTDSVESFKDHAGARLNYSAHRLTEQECWIEPAPILFEDTIRSLSPTVEDHENGPFLFSGNGDLGFDVFAASFYLISRYEEYLPHTVDAYGRFAHDQSLAFRHGFLDRPVVDRWMQQLLDSLLQFYPSLTVRNRAFERLCTYDIDESYAYLYKPIWLQLAGSARDLLRGRFGWLGERIATVLNIRSDPYDSFAFIRSLHVSDIQRPIFFFSVAEKRGQYDKNLSPHHPAQKRLIRFLSEGTEAGLHPSWRSGDEPTLLNSEKKQLEQIMGRSITFSRQHFIRFALPDTYRLLIEAGITDDYSMGYGSINGFRAGTSLSFCWFDLVQNHPTDLRIHPFCYMEANSFFELHHTIDQAAEEWERLERSVRAVNGRMITIWHNTLLGTQKRFAGWRDRYAQWIRG